MSTALEDARGDPASSQRGETCPVAIFYDDSSDRDRALALTDRLVDRFWKQLDFSFSWWRFRYLEDLDIAEAAVAAASDADIVVVSASSGAEPSTTTRDWLQLWTKHRPRRPGVIVPLLHPSLPEEISVSSWMSLLEEVAQESALECLLPSELRDSPLFANPGRPLHQRAHHITGVLDHILNTPHTPPSPPARWGLNE